MADIVEQLEKQNALRDVIAAVDAWERACSLEPSSSSEKRPGEVHTDDSSISKKHHCVSSPLCFQDAEIPKQGTDEGIDVEAIIPRSPALSSTGAPMLCSTQDAGFETPPCSPSYMIDSGSDTPVVSNLTKLKAPEALPPRAVSVTHHKMDSSTSSLPQLDHDDNADGVGSSGIPPVNSALSATGAAAEESHIGGSSVPQPALVLNSRETAHIGTKSLDFEFGCVRRTETWAKQADEHLDDLKSSNNSKVEAAQDWSVRELPPQAAKQGDDGNNVHVGVPESPTRTGPRPRSSTGAARSGEWRHLKLDDVTSVADLKVKTLPDGTKELHSIKGIELPSIAALRRNAHQGPTSRFLRGLCIKLHCKEYQSCHENKVELLQALLKHVEEHRPAPTPLSVAEITKALSVCRVQQEKWTNQLGITCKEVGDMNFKHYLVLAGQDGATDGLPSTISELVSDLQVVSWCIKTLVGTLASTLQDMNHQDNASSDIR
jgi:hypothetical protein